MWVLARWPGESIECISALDYNPVDAMNYEVRQSKCYLPPPSSLP